MGYDSWKTRSPDDEKFRGKPYGDEWDRLRAEYDGLLDSERQLTETELARLEEIELIVRRRWLGR
jgi:hypothetical protein